MRLLTIMATIFLLLIGGPICLICFFVIFGATMTPMDQLGVGTFIMVIVVVFIGLLTVVVKADARARSQLQQNILSYADQLGLDRTQVSDVVLSRDQGMGWLKPIGFAFYNDNQVFLMAMTNREQYRKFLYVEDCSWHELTSGQGGYAGVVITPPREARPKAGSLRIYANSKQVSDSVRAIYQFNGIPIV